MLTVAYIAEKTGFLASMAHRIMMLQLEMHFAKATAL
jgi:hypothetical protein